MKKMTKLVSVLASLVMAGTVQAASVSLTPSSPSVTAGNPISFTVALDFATSFGFLQLSYDPSLLGSASFSYDPSVEASFTTYTPDTSTSGLIWNIGISGAFTGGTLGTVTFSTLGTGVANVSSAADSDPSFRFKNPGSSSYISGITYGDASVQVSAVPVPAALWLMASGLSALGLGLRRKA